MNLNPFTLNKTVEEITAKLTLAEKELTDTKATVEAFAVKQKEFDASLEVIKKEYEAKIVALTNDLELEKMSTNKKAAQVLANIGVEPETIKVALVPSESDILSKFEKLTGNEKSSFYQKNRETILKATGLKQ
jgi:hypothetical protein